MTVKIVTDSLSDITSDLAKELGVTVVPLTVLFGHETFLDRVTMTTEEFYRRLANDTIWPTTTQPTPAAFLEVYNSLAKETDEILVITLSGKMSGTYQSALGAKNMFNGKCRIEIIDSQLVAMGLGLIVISTARKAKAGAKLDELVDSVKKAMPRSHFVVYFDTLKYLAKGGRIGKAQRLLGAMLSVKPMLTIKDGEMAPLTRLRSLPAGLDYLYNFAKGYPDAELVAVEHATTPDEADRLADRLSSTFPKERIFKSVISPVLGVHGGPGAMAVTILEAERG
ncbi:MAG: DegV family protein [Dehalococcoidales bacterium]|nr:DegV family protein [Dehalococcoidales bacterium]